MMGLPNNFEVTCIFQRHQVMYRAGKGIHLHLLGIVLIAIGDIFQSFGCGLPTNIVGMVITDEEDVANDIRRLRHKG